MENKESKNDLQETSKLKTAQNKDYIEVDSRKVIEKSIADQVEHKESDTITVQQPVQAPSKQAVKTKGTSAGCGCFSTLFACSGCFLLLIGIIVFGIIIWINF